jgi:3-hydroxyacyl-CoA dehydrogenase
MPARTPDRSTIAIIGAGSIGVAFVIVFARAGFSIRLQDPDSARREVAPGEILQRLRDLETYALITESPGEILARITIVPTVEEAVADAVLVQECAPERLDLKRELFALLDSLAPSKAILVSSTSALQPSSFAAELPGRARCLVGHPGNPPYLIPVIEIVPAPFTSEAAISRCEEIYRAAGLSPIRLRKEIEGFVFNRLQGALLREAYCLVRDGVVSVDEIDQVVRDGLGRRWSVIGPFETADLNTRGGIAAHAAKMGPAYERMGAERGQHDPWTPELVKQVEEARRALLPLDQWEQRVAWRDRMMMMKMLGSHVLDPAVK